MVVVCTVDNARVLLRLGVSSVDNCGSLVGEDSGAWRHLYVLRGVFADLEGDFGGDDDGDRDGLDYGDVFRR